MDRQEQIIQQHIDNLPAHIRRAIKEFDWSEIVLDIAKKHHLGIDEADIFHDQTLLVMLNIEKANNYAMNLVNTLDISQEEAENMVIDANERIFTELQKRAFSSKETSDKEINTHIIRKEGTGIIPESKIPQDNIAPAPTIQPKHPLKKEGVQSMEKEKLSKTIIKKGDKVDLSLN